MCRGWRGCLPGFRSRRAVSTTPDRYRVPLIMTASQHESGASSFLGTSIAAGTEGMAAVTQALDAIFAHANVPPFVSKQLIQRMVTSNPSPAYVGRVSAVFANNGAGVRGDMKAVIRAILTRCRGARRDRGDRQQHRQIARAGAPADRLGAGICGESPSNAWAIGDTTSSSTRLGESIGHSATVFNFFRPGYTPANTAISTAGLVAPEFQITNELSVVAYVNYMQALIANGSGDFKADYSAILTLAGDSQALIDEVNLVLANGQLSAATTDHRDQECGRQHRQYRRDRPQQPRDDRDPADDGLARLSDLQVRTGPMNPSDTGYQSRRAFLKRSAALGLPGSAMPFVTSLAAIGEAAAAVTTDYKALVCVFLYGGNDYANTLPPYDQASYNLYQAARSNIALARNALDATVLNPVSALAGGRQYALAPTMAPLLPLFNAGKMAVALNVGTLVQPTTKAQYTNTFGAAAAQIVQP